MQCNAVFSHIFWRLCACNWNTELNARTHCLCMQWMWIVALYSESCHKLQFTHLRVTLPLFNSMSLVFHFVHQCHAPCGPGAIPPYPFMFPLSHLLLYLLVSFTFLFFLLTSHFIYFLDFFPLPISVSVSVINNNLNEPLDPFPCLGGC